MPREDNLDPEKRIHVDELVSVGLVAAGANGASDILITKKADEDGGDSKIVAWLRKTFGKDAKPGDAIKEAAEIEKARNVGEWFESRIHADFTNLADGQFGDGYLSRDERIGLSTAIGSALDAFRSDVESNLPELYLRDPWDGPDEDAIVNASTIEPVTAGEASDPGGTMPNAPILSDEIREGLDDATKAYVESLERSLAETPEADPVEKTDEVVPEEVIKEASPEMRELFEKQQAALDAATATADDALAKAKAETDQRLAKEAVEKAAEFGQIAKADEFGPVLRKIEAALDADELAKFESWLKAANATIESGDVWTEFGKTASGGVAMNGAEATVDAKAKELVGTSGGSMTYAQAYDHVLKNDVELAKALDAEQREA